MPLLVSEHNRVRVVDWLVWHPKNNPKLCHIINRKINDGGRIRDDCITSWIIGNVVEISYDIF